MTLYDRLDDRSRIRYPFAENTELRYAYIGGMVTIPDSVFLDASVSAYAGASETCTLLSVMVSSGTLYAQFHMCGETVVVSAPVAGVLGSVPFMASSQLSGSILFGNDGIAALATLLEPDVWYSRADATIGTLERSCVVYSPDGAVMSITGDAPGSSPVTGDIEVVDGVNTRARVDQARSSVVIFAEPGIGLVNCVQQIAPADEYGGEDVVRIFNGAEADATGNAAITTDGRLRLLPSADGTELQLSVAPDIAALVDCTPLYDAPENTVE